MKTTLYLTIFILASLGCSLATNVFPVTKAPTTPTIALVPAKFATPTETTTPTETSPATKTPIATASSTPTLTKTQSITVTKTVTSTVEATDETTVEATDETAIEATNETTVEATNETTVEATNEADTDEILKKLSGRIAFPVDDGAGFYDVWVIDLSEDDPQPFTVWKHATEPNFSNDGRLLVNNHDNEYGEHINLLDVNYAWLGQVSDSPYDSYPFWSPDGQLYAFSNPNLLKDTQVGDYRPHVFIPCSLHRPSEEEKPACREFTRGGKIYFGAAPVWTEDDRIVFFSYEGDDGLYSAGPASALWDTGGIGTKQFIVKTNGYPNDTQANQVFFSSGDIDQNWEAYAIHLDGTNLVNLSNSDYSQDGLPTVSPDGKTVAFISDRDDLWGIWVKPLEGGEPTKLVDLSKINTNPHPWGNGDRDWMWQRISWGP